MSESPRTDELEEQLSGSRKDAPWGRTMATHARQLERELAEAKATSKELVQSVLAEREELAAAEASCAELIEALRELVRLKDLQTRMALYDTDQLLGINNYIFLSQEARDAAYEDYYMNDFPAWEAAHKVIAELEPK